MGPSSHIVLLLGLSIGSCALEQSVAHEVSSGACMLQKASSDMFKANLSLEDFAEGGDMLLIQEAAEHHEWRVQHQGLQEATWKSKGAFEEFLASQTNSSNACSARILESKKQLDGLTARVDDLSSQIQGHQAVLETETLNENAVKKSMKDVETKHANELAICKAQKEEAKADLDRYTKEQEELDAIGSASEKHFRVSLLENSGALDPQSCLGFVQFMRSRRHLSIGTGVGDESCEEQREELQKDFTKAYDQITKLIQSAKDRTEDQTCEQVANAEKDGALSTLTPQQADSSKAILKASQAIASLNPILDSAKEMSDTLENHIEKVLKPECDEAGTVSKTLQAVRDEIHSLEKCPKRKHWELETPVSDPCPKGYRLKKGRCVPS